MKLTPKRIQFDEEDMEMVLSGDVPTSMEIDQSKFFRGMKRLIRTISDAIREIKEANNINEASCVVVSEATGLPDPHISYQGRFYLVVNDTPPDDLFICRRTALGPPEVYTWLEFVLP